MSLFVKFSKVMIAGTVALYAFATLTGYRMEEAEKEKVDPSVRSSPGGYRSFHFWHSGYSGGK
jgi:hypothetical protein